MILGIPFHIAIAFGAIEYHWIVKDSSHSYLVDIGLFSSRLFRMPLFFCISGFFSALTLNKENIDNFIINRTKRLVVPMLVCFIVFIIPIKGLWVAMENSDLLYNFKLIESFEYVTTNYFADSTIEHYRHGANWGHLWFLMYLFCFSIIHITCNRLPRIPAFLKIVFSFIIGLSSYFMMEGYWVDQPFQIYPIVSLLFYYGSFYLMGQALFELKHFKLKLLPSLSILSVGIIGCIFRAKYQVGHELGYLPIDSSILKMAFFSLSCTWLTVWGLIFSAQNTIIKEFSFIRYFTKASYFVYLIHLPLIIIIQIISIKIDTHWSIKLIALSFIIFLVCLGLYKTFVENKWCERFLKGKLSIPFFN